MNIRLTDGTRNERSIRLAPDAKQLNRGLFKETKKEQHVSNNREMTHINLVVCLSGICDCVCACAFSPAV